MESNARDADFVECQRVTNRSAIQLASTLSRPRRPGAPKHRHFARVARSWSHVMSRLFVERTVPPGWIWPLITGILVRGSVQCLGSGMPIGKGIAGAAALVEGNKVVSELGLFWMIRNRDHLAIFRRKSAIA